jgi:crotonobetainyl-CoA:carnitine CoA-transferase CaiB-like acyl-CoA transferase
MTQHTAGSEERQSVPAPLAGIKVVEVAMWAFVPAAAGILSDMGAEVIKIEPLTGDPLRGLQIGGYGADSHGFVLSWENYNRGKKSLSLDLRTEQGLEVLHRLLADADVFVNNLLPAARRRMKIDAKSLRPNFPRLIYAVGSGLGQEGPEAEKGGFDAITFWARGGIAATFTPEALPYPIPQPSAAFGDTTSGAMLAGAVSAALFQRERTGHAPIVEVALLSASMWMMQRSITQAILDGKPSLPKYTREQLSNPLVNIYRTADGRFVALNMLQQTRYWPELCRTIGRPELADDARFATPEAWAKNARLCVAELESVFAGRPLAQWRELLARQDGPWDVVQLVGELKDDPQVNANGFLQKVGYADGRSLTMVSVPMQFDGAPFRARPAPDMGADSDAILASLGYSEEAIVDLKVANVVF